MRVPGGGCGLSLRGCCFFAACRVLWLVGVVGGITVPVPCLARPNDVQAPEAGGPAIAHVSLYVSGNLECKRLHFTHYRPTGVSNIGLDFRQEGDTLKHLYLIPQAARLHGIHTRSQSARAVIRNIQNHRWDKSPVSRLVRLFSLLLTIVLYLIDFSVEAYNGELGGLRVIERFPATAPRTKTVNVNVDNILDSLNLELTQVGAWINVIGYCRQTGKVETSSHPVVDAVVIWSAGAIKLDEYEAAVRGLQTT
ncbi:hypothetical protein Q7P37_002064 [Cladosporium fusiforme]